MKRLIYHIIMLMLISAQTGAFLFAFSDSDPSNMTLALVGVVALSIIEKFLSGERKWYCIILNIILIPLKLIVRPIMLLIYLLTNHRLPERGCAEDTFGGNFVYILTGTDFGLPKKQKMSYEEFREELANNRREYETEKRERKEFEEALKSGRIIPDPDFKYFKKDFEYIKKGAITGYIGGSSRNFSCRFNGTKAHITFDAIFYWHLDYNQDSEADSYEEFKRKCKRNIEATYEDYCRHFRGVTELQYNINFSVEYKK